MGKLFEHQIVGVRRALTVLRRTRGFYLAWDPGMGKTLGFIALARMLKARRILVLSPVVGLGVWLGEIQRWWPEARPLVLRDSTWRYVGGLSRIWRAPSASPGGDARPYVLISNYDQLTGKVGKKRLAALLRLSFDLLILDESHMGKTPTSQRTRAVMKLAARSKYRLLGSGTPSHSPLDWWAQFRVVAPGDPMWAQRFGEYKRQIAYMGGPSGNWVKGFNPRVKERAIQSIARYTHVARVEELHLPGPIFTPVPVTLSARERAAYRQMENLFFVEIAGTEVMSARIALTKGLRLQQITSGHLQPDGVPSTKLAAALELLEQREGQKVIVAARFDWELDELWREVSKRTTRVWSIRGGVDYQSRKLIERTFQTDPHPQVLLLNYQAGGMALTLTRADALLLYSMSTSLIQFEQMIGRIHRIGTTTHVQVLPLLAQDTMDEDLYAGLIRRSDDEGMMKLIVDGMRKRNG